MAHQIWSIEGISCLGMCKDSGGHHALRANSYRVELSAGIERLNVEVAVTHVAFRYAMACLCGESVIYEANVKAVEQELVRCSSTRNTRMYGGGWDPRTTPWLTIDIEDIQEIVERLTCLAAAE